MSSDIFQMSHYFLMRATKQIFMGENISVTFQVTSTSQSVAEGCRSLPPILPWSSFTLHPMPVSLPPAPAAVSLTLRYPTHLSPHPLSLCLPCLPSSSPLPSTLPSLQLWPSLSVALHPSLRVAGELPSVFHLPLSHLSHCLPADPPTQRVLSGIRAARAVPRCTSRGSAKLCSWRGILTVMKRAMQL